MPWFLCLFATCLHDTTLIVAFSCLNIRKLCLCNCELENILHRRSHRLREYTLRPNLGAQQDFRNRQKRGRGAILSDKLEYCCLHSMALGQALVRPDRSTRNISQPKLVFLSAKVHKYATRLVGVGVSRRVTRTPWWDMGSHP